MASFFDQIRRFIPRAQTPQYSPVSRRQNYTPRVQAPQYSPAQGYGARSGGHSFVQTPGGGRWSPTPASQGTTGSVLGTRDVAGGEGGGGDTQPTPTQQQPVDQGAPFEQAPEQPSIDYNAIFAPAFEALSGQEQAARAGTEAGIAGVEQEAAGRRAGILSEQESRLGQFGQQRREATGQTESAISQARRQAAELQQGIQARFGGTTGTGRFTSEVLGAQATQNSAQNQAALQNTLGKITQSENELRTKVTDLVNQEDQRLETAKLNLRAQLQQTLAAIGGERGRLETEKAQSRIDILNQYQQVLASINQRNTAFKQSLFLQAQQAQDELEKLRARAQDTYRVNLTPANLATLVSSEVITPEQAQTGVIGQDITGLSPEDIFGVATGQTDEEGELGSALGL